MSKNRIAILVLIVGMTALIGYFIGKSVLGGNQLKPIQVEDTRALQTNIVAPDPAVFYTDAINPTTPITISQNNQNLIGN